MEKFMENLKKYWGWITLITAILGAIVAIFLCFHRLFNYFDSQNEELAETQKIAQQALIWNKEIPNIQRAEVCDIYLSKGFDSYTKKLCENVILADEDIKVEKESVKYEESMDRFEELYNSDYYVAFRLLHN